jgi:4-hydroxy-tetrahydrodipicolinate synthase
MRKPLFTGVCTALVTPFIHNKINFPMADILLQRQIDARIPAVVVCGTTGEAPTLSDEEKIQLIARSKQYAGNHLLIIAGTGSNNTEHAVHLSKAAQDAGADALLIVSPYYNKATDTGLIAHFIAIAHAVTVPIILYNVPSRTGVDIPVKVYQQLSQVPNIIGVKEASADIEKLLKIRSACGSDFSIWTGNDSMTVPAISLGCQGVISVASNLIPRQMQDMAAAAIDGDLTRRHICSYSSRSYVSFCSAKSTRSQSRRQ